MGRVAGIMSSDPKSRQAQPKARRLYTPEPVQQRVVALHLSGQSNRQIASAENIDRETVGRILSQEEVLRLKAQARSQLLRLLPKAIDVYDQALSSGDPRIEMAAATKILEAGGMLQPEDIFDTTPDPRQRKGDATQTEPEPDWWEQPKAYLARSLNKVLENLADLPPYVLTWARDAFQMQMQGPKAYLGTILNSILGREEPTIIPPQVLEWLRDQLRIRLPEAAIERIREVVPEAALLLPPPKQGPV